MRRKREKKTERRNNKFSTFRTSFYVLKKKRVV